MLIGYTVNNENVKSVFLEIGQNFKTVVLLKGAQLADSSNEMVDVLFNCRTGQIRSITNLSIETNNIHGTGYFLSAPIAAFLSLENDLEIAARKAC